MKLRIIDKREFSHDQLSDHFNNVMNHYDLQRRLAVLIDEFLAGFDVTGKRVLEAGCGTGHASKLLAMKGARVTSLDLGFSLVRIARQRAGTLAVQGDVLMLPFPDESFQLVFSTEVIEHTPHPLMAVDEMVRVLIHGGLLILSTPNRLWQWPVRLASALGLREYKGLENFSKPSLLRQTLADKGRILEHRGIHLLPFQFEFLHPWLQKMDRFGKALLPLMINQCILFQKK